MKIDDFAPNLSFFFSNGMDPEYAVIGRVARRIWARAMRDLYHAGPRSQMLKYHVQTSGRSLHAQEIQFNDIRTTLQAMYALFDNCNSLHTNAYDEALTTPTEESVRRAVAIQLIINRELGLNKNQNPWQGSYFLEQLTDLVEEAVYKEFDSLSERGGVLGAMETMYQRGKIQEESMFYERQKHDGTLPIIGVNTFLSHADPAAAQQSVALIRSSEEEKQAQVTAVHAFQARNNGPCARGAAATAAGRNVRRQRFRGAHQQRALVLAGADLAGAVRRRRPVSSQRLTPSASPSSESASHVSRPSEGNPFRPAPADRRSAALGARGSEGILGGVCRFGARGGGEVRGGGARSDQQDRRSRRARAGRRKASSCRRSSRDAYAQFVEGGWPQLRASPAHGGQGAPTVLGTAVEELWASANLAFKLCPMLTQGAIEALERCGTAEQTTQVLVEDGERRMDRDDEPHRAAGRQ